MSHHILYISITILFWTHIFGGELSLGFASLYKISTEMIHFLFSLLSQFRCNAVLKHQKAHDIQNFFHKLRTLSFDIIETTNRIKESGGI